MAWDPRSSMVEARRVLDALLADGAAMGAIASAGGVLSSCLANGGKVLACGNGGSLCDAAHFAEELTGRFRADRPALAAIACAEPGHLTCTANDYGYERVFSRWVEALGRRGDVLVVLSTSGRSANISMALEAARAAGVRTIGLLGKDGGAARGLCEIAIVVPGETPDRIQELHMLILHGWVEAIEAVLFGRG